VYFDHLLARDWPHRAADAAPLDAFTARVYAMLHARHAALPPALKAIAPRMAAADWLGGYRERGSVDLAVSRMAGRLSRHGDRLVDALDDVRRLEARVEATFDTFFPELIAFVDREREPGP